MSSSCSTRLTLEELDGRVMPTVFVPITLPPVTIAAVASPATHPLHGDAGGSSTATASIGGEDRFVLIGTANLGGRGSFALTGFVQVDGRVAQKVGWGVLYGHGEGELVFTNAYGTISVTLHDPALRGVSRNPSHFHYTISGGTGAYQHLSGSGRVYLVLLPAPTAAGQPSQGTFNLTFFWPSPTPPPLAYDALT